MLGRDGSPAIVGGGIVHSACGSRISTESDRVRGRIIRQKI
jgi:hypothetical protein